MAEAAEGLMETPDWSAFAMARVRVALPERPWLSVAVPLRIAVPAELKRNETDSASVGLRGLLSEAIRVQVLPSSTERSMTTRARGFPPAGIVAVAPRVTD